MSNQIEIKIEAKRLTPDKFLAGAKDFFALVEGVAKNVTLTGVSWSVEVDKGSAIVRMRPEHPTAETERVISVVSQGVRALRNRITVIPHGFTNNELLAARRLTKLADGDSIQIISICNGGPPEVLQEAVAETADAILGGQSQIAFGGIEGKIITLSAKHGLICTIYDPIQRREVTCYLQTEKAQEDAVKGYTKRVIASGLIHYTKEGQAVSVTVDTIRIFPSDSELPSIEDVQAIYKLYQGK
jgi:hypothetical protein